MKLNEIETLLYIQAGAPAPVILANEYKLNLLYYYHKDTESDGSYDSLKQRNISVDKGIAIMGFKNFLIYKFGYPNAEVLQSHPYYSLGLEPYKLFEVIESDWINKIEMMNKVHPFHNPIRYKMYKHFILTFEDSTFECIAHSTELVFIKSTMTTALHDLSAIL